MNGRNHRDNMKWLGRFVCHCSALIAEQEFFDFVFLQGDGVWRISPRDGDRAPRAAAERAINFGNPPLSKNWNLDENVRRRRRALPAKGQPHGDLVVWTRQTARNNPGLGISRMIRARRLPTQL